MIDIQDRTYAPTLEELCGYVRNPAFARFCGQLQERFQAVEKIEYSRCSLEPGWNIKWKRSGRSLCTVYPRESFFTVLVVVGQKQREAAEAFLRNGPPRIREIYEQTREGNGQRWLMIDLEDEGLEYEAVLDLIAIRRAG